MSPRRRGSVDLGRAASRARSPRNTYAVFYVVTEGQGTEHDYLDRLDKAYGPRCKFRIRMPLPHVRRNGLSPSDVIKHACGLADASEIKQAWGLFDHDDRGDIDQVCSAAKRTRVAARRGVRSEGRASGRPHVSMITVWVSETTEFVVSDTQTTIMTAIGPSNGRTEPVPDPSRPDPLHHMVS